MTRTRPPQPQVSVIVPVYNQEQYLEECISSIRRQTLAEWECIIVNDGSSDSSGEIARRFSEEDSRIRCLEQENRAFPPPAIWACGTLPGAICVLLTVTISSTRPFSNIFWTPRTAEQAI